MAGQTNQTFTVPILNDGLVERFETFQAFLSNPMGGAQLGARSNATFQIMDNDLGLHFEPNTYWISESEGTVTLAVARGNDVSLGAFTVDYETRNGTALAEQDYGAIQGTLLFAEGELRKLLTIPITCDESSEPDETFTVLLQNPAGVTEPNPNYSLATVTIVESVKPWVADPRVAQMLTQVQPSDLRRLLAQVTGEECVLVGGNAHTIKNRNTSSDPRTPIWKATQLAYDSLQALDLDVEYQTWASGNANLVGTQAGEFRPDEFVLVVAHLDDAPIGLLAPGANDNATGVAAVLTAARIFSQYRFERSIQYVLFTGEEQGMQGSAAFAAKARAEGRKLGAVINVDMVGHQLSVPPRCSLITRSKSSGHEDFAIAYPFLKAVEAYGLGGSLWPSFRLNFGQTDHVSFWNNGFPALSVIEFAAETAPYMHTAEDTLRLVNLPYLRTTIQAILATAAHLAQPTGERPLGILEVATSDWTPGSGIGGAFFCAKYMAEASENENDAFDLAWANSPANTNAQWLKISTEPYGVPLHTDARPLDSETMFRTLLSVIDNTGTAVSCVNRLRFCFLTPPEADRIYLARIRVDGRYTTGATDFDRVVNIREVVAGGGFVDLPSLNQVPDGMVYGTCDLVARFLDTESAHCTLRLASVSDQSIVLMADAQVGAQVVDDLEVSTDLDSNTAWERLKFYTNYVTPEAAHFEAGWTAIERELDRSLFPESGARFFRLKRTWINP
ncbi:MAG TPA: M20/M25/M40 family metallo-hydrolase [Candidatus Paceibacterota bacterium]|nr:M20/M25/M40 family metallo-hydrolase [Verrucomicrobiota bacterium]HRY51577.1 M20/M25/M40 family metallo-hydrolase [Candidatus Paceibacterota bacterium]